MIAGRSRLLPLDALRGLIIVLMALDHANYFVAQRHPPGEHWGGLYPSYDSAIASLTRFVTHLSAPGFFFLMGVGMVLFSAHRLDSGWSLTKIRRQLVLRGLILIVFQYILVNPIWKISPIPFPDWYQGVLVALGATMIIGTALVRMPAGMLLLMTVTLSLIIEITHPDPSAWGSLNDTPLGLILAYSGGTQNFWVNYPILAWLEFVLFGMAFGVWFRDKPKIAYRRALLAGVLLIAAFIPTRALNGFGNIRPMDGSTWIDFFNVVKYPPSWAFTFLTMGLNLLLLRLLHWCSNRMAVISNILAVYGRAPFFIYLTHLLLYALLGRIFTPNGSSYLLMYVFWFAGLALLYTPAKCYARIKRMPATRPFLQYL